MKGFLKRVAEVLSDALFPRDIKCIVCDGELETDTPFGLCPECSLPENDDKACLKCGSAVNNLGDYCNRCRNRIFSFERAASALIYEGEAERLVRAFKFGGCRYLHTYFAHFMAKTYTLRNMDADLVLPVPLSAQRLKERGYNQSALLAETLAEILGLPYLDLLSKIKHTDYQARRGFLERLENIKGAFALKENAKEALCGKRILLVDDVMTTGSTAEECAAVLKKGRAASVLVLTLASPRPRVQMY